jgi:hypothetical protein
MDDLAGASRGMRRLFVDVSDKVAENLSRLAQAAGSSRNVYINNLFLAAYSARCAPTGDRALDAAMRGDPPNMGSGGKREPPDRDFAEIARQLVAAKERETALAADHDKAKKTILDYAAQIGNAASIERVNANLKAELVAARATIMTLEAGDCKVSEKARLTCELAAAKKRADELKTAARLAREDASDAKADLVRANASIEPLRAELARANLALAEGAQREAGVVSDLAKAIKHIQSSDTLFAPEPVPSPVEEIASGPPIALTGAEAKIVRGFAAAGLSARKIADKTGFSPAQIAPVLKKRAAK